MGQAPAVQFQIARLDAPADPGALRIGRGSAQARITAGKSALQVTVKVPRFSTLASEREQWKPSSGRIARRRGSTQKTSGSARSSAIGNTPLR
jgi:hypothetical protein